MGKKRERKEVAQKPILKVGTPLMVGDWDGTVEAIEKERVIIRLRNGKRFPVAFSVIERAAVQ